MFNWRGDETGKDSILVSFNLNSSFLPRQYYAAVYAVNAHKNILYFVIEGNIWPYEQLNINLNSQTGSNILCLVHNTAFI